jgi:hypothetical protein
MLRRRSARDCGLRGVGRSHGEAAPFPAMSSSWNRELEWDAVMEESSSSNREWRDRAKDDCIEGVSSCSGVPKRDIVPFRTWVLALVVAVVVVVVVIVEDRGKRGALSEVV